MAQIGVLEVLSAAGLRVRAVAGTSAGAIVGAAYCADRLDAFREAMCSLTRTRVWWLFDPTWPRSGMLEGRRAMEFIRPYVGERIEDLPRRYAAVAADLRSGAEVVLRSGEVAEAIRASIAIPGVFTPCPRDGRLLVDGGLVNPLPVSVARDLGSDFVVAVSVLPVGEEAARGNRRDLRRLAALLRRRSRSVSSLGLPSVEEVRSCESPGNERVDGDDVDGDIGIVELISRVSVVVQCRIAASCLREAPADFLIHVPPPPVGIFDFHRSRELVEAGRAAARDALPAPRRALDAAAPLERIRRWLRACAGSERGGTSVLDASGGHRPLRRILAPRR
jgi:NTE family protein